jgi:glycogen synthase
MPRAFKSPRILFVTPEVSHLPAKLCAIPDTLRARAGELGDFSASLISALCEKGADVHVTFPDYRTLFNNHENPMIQTRLTAARRQNADTQIHLAQDRAFFYKKKIYSDSVHENIRASVSFQREVINTIVPRIQPDLIHCNDWMTGLIPAMARRLGIPCLFTVHNFYNAKALLSSIEDRGIDAALFWQNLFFERPPVNYEETRSQNPVDFFVSGIFAAHFVNTTCPWFLRQMIQGESPFVDTPIRSELLRKETQDCASWILNAPDASRLPETNTALIKNYNEKNHVSGKKANKLFLQKRLGIRKNPGAPVFFWPSYLDRMQNRFEWIKSVWTDLLFKYPSLEILVAANGTFQTRINDIIRGSHLKERVAVFRPEDPLSRVAYAASDFILIPSASEPVSFVVVTGLLHGALPITHNIGGGHEFITPLDMGHNKGNGFLFNPLNYDGLSRAVDRALGFYDSPGAIKSPQVRRIMKNSRDRFNSSRTAEQYIFLYEKMMKRPFLHT